MTRILLACGIGASTGFMAANMRKAAKAQGLDVSIHAVSKSQVPEYADKIDVLLLGPHFSAEVPKYKDTVMTITTELRMTQKLLPIVKMLLNKKGD